MKTDYVAAASKLASTFHRRGFTKPTGYFFILVLAYYLGYLSALTKNPSTKTLNHNQPPQSADIDHYQFQTQCANPVPYQLARKIILNRVFNDTSPYMNFPQPHIEPFLRHKRIKGWGSTGAVFENLIRKVKPKVIIEIGTFLGASAIHMAELTRQLGLDTQILCIDDFRGWPDLPSKFKDIKMSALENLCQWGVFGDLIEVDAGHDFHSAWSDINRAYKLLRPGGVIFGHDYFTVADNRGVRRAVNMFARVNGLRVKADGQHWVLESR
ncbi:hypothetical protein CTI12_AA434700 [Artemisia annua]|uniref:S-adenosyl-L-methionine-dependent methyltransferases superfamily protein n=1 Tax=Artemisia annua TaxID=35608 RepID=A0A2U1M1L3_ARTAN|nr:hypothetical protein CTI12_AA434700 [Artemisia annua]